MPSGNPVLVVADKPESFRILLRLAVPYARRRGMPIVLFCLEQFPGGEETFTEPPEWLRKLRDKLGKDDISLQIMAGRSPKPARTIREAVHRLRAGLLILGWEGEEHTGRKKPGPVLTPLLSDPPCNLAVMRLRGRKRAFKRVLVPTAGGPNARLAVEIAHALAEENNGNIALLYVLRPGADPAQHRLAEETIAQTAGPLSGSPALSPFVAEARSPTEGIIAEARRGYDLILIGASREGVITRVLFGEVPLKVARQAPTPVVIVKQMPGTAMHIARRGWDRLLALFPTLSEEDKIAAYREVRRGARPDTDFYFMMGLSAAIASLGLLLNSPAVIIGAMLVAPLMSAVIGLGLGVVQGDVRFLRLAITAVLKGMLLAIAIGLAAGLITPTRTVTPEISARIRPTLLDLGVALASGLAGAYAICRKDVSAALPGVAIAAALIPPLATVGLGLSLGDWKVAAGALLLFLTNLVAIAAGGGLIFLLLGFSPGSEKESRFRVFERGMAGLGALLLIIMVILVALSTQTVKQHLITREVRRVVVRELASWDDAALEEVIVASRGARLEVAVVVRSPLPATEEKVQELQSRLAEELNRPVVLEFTLIPFVRVGP